VKRPSNGPKKQRRCYSGKKKWHTLKAQFVIDRKTKQVICTAHGRGREHDFRLFKRSQVRFDKATECLGDRGYQGLQKLHAKSQTPKKRPPRQTLSKAERRANRELASRRIVCEHVIGKLKVFRILMKRYRNRRKRFGLRLNLIAAIYNFELKEQL